MVKRQSKTTNNDKKPQKAHLNSLETAATQQNSSKHRHFTTLKAAIQAAKVKAYNRNVLGYNA